MSLNLHVFQSNLHFFYLRYLFSFFFSPPILISSFSLTLFLLNSKYIPSLQIFEYIYLYFPSSKSTLFPLHYFLFSFLCFALIFSFDTNFLTFSVFSSFLSSLSQDVICFILVFLLLFSILLFFSTCLYF